jgi:hypothetical protein
VRIERDTTAYAEVTDPAQRAVEMGTGLGVDDDQLAAGLDVPG